MGPAFGMNFYDPLVFFESFFRILNSIAQDSIILINDYLRKYGTNTHSFIMKVASVFVEPFDCLYEIISKFRAVGLFLT